MDDREKRDLALRFCTLSSKDQKSILAQLPNYVRNELLNTINVLDDKDFNSRSSNGFSIYKMKDSVACESWSNFLMQVEARQSGSDLNLPVKLLQIIKDINKIA